jgi:hypothetical protein
VARLKRRPRLPAKVTPRVRLRLPRITGPRQFHHDKNAFVERFVRQWLLSVVYPSDLSSP